MKIQLFLIAVAILCGCRSSEFPIAASTIGDDTPMAENEGIGPKRIFAAPYGVVWDSALRIVKQKGLVIKSLNEANGFIEAESAGKSGGELVGIWLHETGEEATEVEVYFRVEGNNRELMKTQSETILNSIAQALGLP